MHLWKFNFSTAQTHVTRRSDFYRASGKRGRNGAQKEGNKYLWSKDEHHGGGSAQLRAHKAEQIFDVGPGPGEDEQAERESR